MNSNKRPQVSILKEKNFTEKYKEDKNDKPYFYVILNNWCDFLIFLDFNGGFLVNTLLQAYFSTF